MRVLIFATDVPPLSGVPTSGTALRTFGFKKGFEALGFEVTVCVPKMAWETVYAKPELSDETKSELKKLEPYCFDHNNADSLIYALKPNFIYCGHWPAACFHNFPNAPVVIDLAGPHLLERFYQSSGDHAGGVRAKLNALSGGDFFIVSGKRQKEYFKSFLIRAGVDNLDERIIVSPMALPPETPVRNLNSETAEDVKFLFAGIFLPWQNPSVGLTALVEEITQQKKGRLRLVGGFHPTYPVPGGVYEKLFANIERNSRVSRSELISIDELNREMLNANVALDLMEWNLERELAVTIRTTTYLWSGLPVIYNNFSDLSDLIREYNAGWLVDPSNREQIKNTVAEILNNPTEILVRSKQAKRLAENEFSWVKHATEISNRIARKRVKRKFNDFINDRKENADFYLGEGKEINQTFISRHDGLSKIEARIAVHNSEGRVEFVLSDETNLTTEISRKSVDVNGENEHFWIDLNFPTIPDSKDRKFNLKITSTNSNLAVWVSNFSSYPQISFSYNGKLLKERSLCMRATCSKELAL